MWGFLYIPSNWWRSDIDKEDFDYYDFQYFENVTNTAEMNTNVATALSPFQISNTFKMVLADLIYKYCYHKLINLRDVKRWVSNFYGDIGLWLLDNARYLQAYDRDVNNGIKNKGTDNTVSDHEVVNGTVTTGKSGTSSNVQTNNISSGDSQSSNNSVGDTLTILNNETTSTNFLASKNDESFSRGEVSETANKDISKGDSTSMGFAVNNNNSLSKGKSRDTELKSGTYSNLDIATAESNFKFQPLYYQLTQILDEYFTLGGSNYA